MISNQNIMPVVSYAKSEGIKIDFSGFLYQAENHPDYPSILSISDTLNFFNIENGAVQVNTSEIDLLPDRFVVLLHKDESNPVLCFIKKKDDAYFNILGAKAIEISKSELEYRWGNLVLLIENSNKENVGDTDKDKFSWALPLLLLCFIFFLLILTKFEGSIISKLFFIFPLVGILLSIATLKDLFVINNKLLDHFCNITASSSCAKVVSSSQWKIFEYVNFSDLSIVFFTSQFLILLLSVLTNDNVDFFSIQKTLVFLIIPVLLLSIYYQKFVEKKWCPICLSITALILMEIGYFIVFKNDNFAFSVQSLLVFGFLFFSTMIFWLILKNPLTEQKDLKEFQIKGNRLIRNYEVFKNTLLVSPKINYKTIDSGNIVLGNIDTSLKIIIISSPFCEHCAKVHALIEEVLKRYSDKVCFDIRFNFNSKQSDNKSKRVHQKLVQLYYETGQYAYIKVLHDWFKNRDEDKLNPIGISTSKVNELLDEQYDWNQENNILFTPEIIINQYVFPKQYDMKDLIYFINDLSEDEDLIL